MPKLKVKLTFTREMLGSKPMNKDILKTYVAALRPEGEAADEIEAAARAELAAHNKEEQSTSIFHRDPESGQPMIYDYQLKGFFKAACGFLRMVPGTLSADIKAYKKHIDGLIHVFPRFLVTSAKDVGPMNTRSLRADTAQGPRVSIKSSETVPEGTTIDAEIEYLHKGHLDLIKEWLDFGRLSGLGEWRNAGFGRFSWEETT